MNTSVATSIPCTLELGREQQVSLDASRGHLRVLQGLAWVTEAGRSDDAVLVAGDEWPLTGRALVIGALAPLRVQLVGTQSLQARHRPAWWRRLAGAARLQVRRLHMGSSLPQSWT